MLQVQHTAVTVVYCHFTGPTVGNYFSEVPQVMQDSYSDTAHRGEYIGNIPHLVINNNTRTIQRTVQV